MKKTLPIFLLITAFFFAGCNLLGGTTPATDSVSEEFPVSDTTETVDGGLPTDESLNGLNQELEQTVDDGGQSDLQVIESESSGL